ncbi:MAG: hypothetical protein ACYC6Y_07265 [Thermoguttaceae bacterium]
MASIIDRIVLLAAVLLQAGSSPGQEQSQDTWRTAGDGAAAAATAEPTRPAPAADANPALAGSAAPAPVARVSMGQGALPNDQGQLWREYDISPYTLQVASTNRPEQALVDWILQETGYEAWHGEPLAILSASRRSLYVYHTPQMQKAVADIVDRFVMTDANAYSFSLRVITIGSPSWRVRAQQLFQPIQIQTAGAQAWLLQKEAAVNVMAELARRSDFREHSSPQQIVSNGQSTVVSSTRSQQYVRDIRLTGSTWPGFQAETAVVDEGYSLELSPLLSIDRATIEAVVKCQIDLLEKMVPIMLDVPTTVAPRQRAKIEVPQLAHFQFHERFQWPQDKVLLIGMGMIPLPASATEAKSLLPGLPIPGVGTGDNRGDLLVFIEARQSSAPLAPATNTASQPRPANAIR